MIRFYRSAEAKAAGISLQTPRPLDAGFDLPSLAAVTIPAHSSALLRTGIHLAIPESWVGIVRDRSSIALRGGAVTAGVIDASYRGEVKIIMHNLSGDALVFEPGERIAQLLVVPHLEGSRCAEVESLDALGASERGSEGFGSTGK